MEKELQEQLKKVLSDNVGNFWAGTDNIISFIDQNFIGKEEVNIKVLEGKKDILKEIVLEFEGNRLDGKGYDFYLSINDKLNKLLELLK